MNHSWRNLAICRRTDTHTHTHTHTHQLMSYELVYTSIHSSIKIIITITLLSAAAGGCVSLRLATAKWSLTPCAAARVYVCQTLACRPGEFRCGTRCLPPSWVCDGEKDCPGGQDENDCGELPHRPTLSHDAFTQPRCSALFTQPRCSHSRLSSTRMRWFCISFLTPVGFQLIFMQTDTIFTPPLKLQRPAHISIRRQQMPKIHERDRLRCRFATADLQRHMWLIYYLLMYTSVQLYTYI